MAITANPYGSFLLLLGEAFHNLPTDTHNVALLTSDYGGDLDSDSSYDDLTASEIDDDSGTPGGYATGGIALTNKTWTYNASGDFARLNADPISWSALTGTFRYAIIYRALPGNNLIGLIDFGEDKIFNAEPCQLAFTNGVISITGA